MGEVGLVWCDRVSGPLCSVNSVVQFSGGSGFQHIFLGPPYPFVHHFEGVASKG